jgi:hypothetical protein
MTTVRRLIARATHLQLIGAGLLGLLLVITVNIMIGRQLERNDGTAEPTGRGQQEPGQILAAFGQATALGDYSTGSDLLQQGNPWMTDLWRSETERQIQAGHIQAFNQVRQLEQRGQTTVALLEWTGNEAPWCLWVSLDQAGKLTPLSSYGHCERLQAEPR